MKNNQHRKTNEVSSWSQLVDIVPITFSTIKDGKQLGKVGTYTEEYGVFMKLKNYVNIYNIIINVIILISYQFNS